MKQIILVCKPNDLSRALAVAWVRMSLRESCTEGRASAWARMVHPVAAAVSRGVPDTCNPGAQQPVSSPASPTHSAIPAASVPAASGKPHCQAGGGTHHPPSALKEQL